jgi:hypothetical protein
MVQFSRTVDVTLDDGETERFVVQTLGDDAVKVELSGTSAPYDIDIQTSSEHPDPESQFDSSNYSSSLPMGSETYEDTDDHVTATQIVDESVYVEVVNNSGSQAQFSGIIETHSSDSPQSALGFITEGGQSKPAAFRDGRQIANAREVQTSLVETDEGPNKKKHAETISDAQTYIDDGDPRDRRLIITLPSETTLTPSEDDLPLVLGQWVTIDGQNSSIDVPDGYDGNVIEHIRSTPVVESPNRDRRSQVQNLSIIGDQTDGSVGMYIAQVPFFRTENVDIFGLSRGIVLEDGTFFANILGTQVKNHTVCGIELRAGPGGSKPNGSRLQVSVLHGDRTNNPADGIRVRNAAGVRINGNAETNNGYNILLDSVRGCDITGTFESGGFKLDRDGDGNIDPVSIGIDPDDDGQGGRSRGVSIHGAHFNHGDAVGVLAGSVTGLDIRGCNFRGTPDTDGLAVGIGHLATDVNVSTSNRFDDELEAVIDQDPIQRGEINLSGPQKINNGMWKTSLFNSIESLERFASRYPSNESQGYLTVQINSEIITTDSFGINGGFFPQYTKFVGVGYPSISVDGDADAAVRISRKGQTVRGVRVDASNASSGLGFGVYCAGSRTHVEDVVVTGASGDGVRLNDNRCTCRNVRVESGNVTDEDINVAGENCRVVACDASVADNSSNGAETVANTDSL